MTITTLSRAWRGWLAGATLAFAAHAGASAQALPTASPEELGLSSERLGRVGAWLQAEVDAKRIPGAVIMVVRNGRVGYYQAVGRQDPARPDPMSRDSIFRIYSMTKPLVSVATLMLAEEGKLVLEAPVSRYIPSFANTRVGVEKTDPATGAKSLELVPQRRPITVQDLLRHTSGLTYGFFGESLVKKAYLDAGVGAGDFTTAEFAEKLATLPLHYQPGSTWDYSYSTDVLGRVLEVVTGQSLYSVLRGKLLDPLGMKDTSFYVTEPARQARIAEPLPEDRVIGAGATVGNPRIPTKFESGGGGLVSTATDYARFLQMMLNGGSLDGRRYLSPTTVRYMTSDHLGTSVATTPLYLPGAGYGFGLGFAVRKVDGEAPYNSPAGEYNWGGAGGTYFWADPRHNMFVVFMMQSPKQRVPYRSVLRNMVYAAVEK
ncbi:MAG TPA: serine hydrolase domain-containing protein [Ramlibacter sp.]|jgi:CubicO group peptidase (beta-lactamase class C family)|uniref:serine hydrolase domain-containing protein n=1 Tax=Ramlibacter sp. TaxID=1917967 RepID=UPI002D2B9F82|nr:serine hydrolase domain-containing protein [Ramlibacter sp.]HZY20160.1 serine hydrolase domain-containing protein [Ramlibacter sp.]